MSSTKYELNPPTWMNFDKKELEKQYSPSQWSKRYSADEVIKQHVQTARNVSVEVKAKYHTRVDISYLQKPRTKLDIVGEDLPGECQVVMYVHGGYWQELSKELSFLPSGSFYDQGILTIIVGYTLAPTAKFSEIIEEIRAALLWTVNYCGKRGSKGLFLMGWSAGGHLLTEVLSSMPLPVKTDLSIKVLKGVITLAGVFDIRPIVATYVNDPLQLTEKEAWNLSPMRKTQELSQSFPTIKMLISVGENDSPEFKRQSFQYCEELRRNKMTATYEQVPSVDHFDLVEKLSNPDFTLTRKLIDFVKTQ